MSTPPQSHYIMKRGHMDPGAATMQMEKAVPLKGLVKRSKGLFKSYFLDSWSGNKRGDGHLSK